MAVPQINTVLPYDPAIPLLGIYLKKVKTLIQKDICTMVFTATLFTITNIWRQPHPLIVKWIKKIDIYIYIYIYNGIFVVV